VDTSTLGTPQRLPHHASDVYRRTPTAGAPRRLDPLPAPTCSTSWCSPTSSEPTGS